MSETLKGFLIATPCMIIAAVWFAKETLSYQKSVKKYVTSLDDSGKQVLAHKVKNMKWYHLTPFGY